MKTYRYKQDLSRQNTSTWEQTLFFSRIFLIFLLLSTSMLTACFSSAPEVPKQTAFAEEPDLVLWSHVDNGIILKVRSDRNLNVYNLKAHSVQLCIYQLDNPAAFRELGKTAEGITVLLKAEAFDKSVKNVTRMFLQPLETTNMSIDRVEGAKYVAAVAGFFNATPQNSIGLWPIGLDETRKGLVFKTTYYSAGTMELSLHLGENSISGGVVGRESEEEAELKAKAAKNKEKNAKSSTKGKSQTNSEPATSKTEGATSEPKQIPSESSNSVPEQAVTQSSSAALEKPEAGSSSLQEEMEKDLVKEAITEAPSQVQRSNASDSTGKKNYTFF